MRIRRRSSTRVSAEERRLRSARVRAARAHPGWVEIEDDLVERDAGQALVSVSSDRVYRLEVGDVWETSSARLVADYPELCFVVRDRDELVLLREEPDSWTDVLLRRARSGSAA